MARIRTIKPEFAHSESMGNVSRDARLTFVLLWTIADDEGRTRGATRLLASLLFPYDEDIAESVEGWLAELEREECIKRYEIDGAVYLQILNWQQHQKIDRPSQSKIPAPANAVPTPPPSHGSSKARDGSSSARERAPKARETSSSPRASRARAGSGSGSGPGSGPPAAVGGSRALGEASRVDQDQPERAPRAGGAPLHEPEPGTRSPEGQLEDAAIALAAELRAAGVGLNDFALRGICRRFIEAGGTVEQARDLVRTARAAPGAKSPPALLVDWLKDAPTWRSVLLDAAPAKPRHEPSTGGEPKRIDEVVAEGGPVFGEAMAS